jgi:hypothetical protein
LPSPSSCHLLSLSQCLHLPVPTPDGSLPTSLREGGGKSLMKVRTRVGKIPGHVWRGQFSLTASLSNLLDVQRDKTLIGHLLYFFFFVCASRTSTRPQEFRELVRMLQFGLHDAAQRSTSSHGMSPCTTLLTFLIPVKSYYFSSMSTWTSPARGGIYNSIFYFLYRYRNKSKLCELFRSFRNSFIF